MTIKRMLSAAAVVGVLAACGRADSLWTEHSRSLVADNRAHRPGDVVTVVVVETARVSTSANTSTSKETATQADVGTVDIPSAQIFPGSQRPKVDASSARTFDGEGSYSLQGSMETRLTAVVLEVLPNGNMVIEGSRLQQSVDDKVTVRVTGIIRPDDIRADNTVLSTSVAEGKIVFESSGPISRANRRGILGRIVDFIWPF